MRWAIADLVVKDPQTQESYLDVCIITRSWLSVDGMSCLYPTHLRSEEILSAAKRCLQPTAQYKTYPASIRKWFDTFDAARKKLKRAADKTDISSSEVDYDTRGRPKRKSKAARPNLAVSTDSENDDDLQPARKRAKKTSNPKPLVPYPSFGTPTVPSVSKSASGSNSASTSGSKQRSGASSANCRESVTTASPAGSVQSASRSQPASTAASCSKNVAATTSSVRSKSIPASGGGSQKRLDMHESPKRRSSAVADLEALDFSAESDNDELLIHASTPDIPSEEDNNSDDDRDKDYMPNRSSHSPDSVSSRSRSRVESPRFSPIRDYDVNGGDAPDSSTNDLEIQESGNGSLEQNSNEDENGLHDNRNDAVKEKSAQRKRSTNITTGQINKMDGTDIVRVILERLLEVQQDVAKCKQIGEEMRQLLLNRTEILKLPDGLSDLPFKTFDDARIAEDLAKNKDNVKDFLMKRLSFANKGNTENECAKKVMGLLMTNHTGNFFNWKGNNGKTPFEHWTLKDIVISVVRKLRGDVIDTKLAENGIKEWFKSRKSLLK